MTVLVRYPSLDILVVMDTMASDQIYSVLSVGIIQEQRWTISPECYGEMLGLSPKVSRCPASYCVEWCEAWQVPTAGVILVTLGCTTVIKYGKRNSRNRQYVPGAPRESHKRPSSPNQGCGMKSIPRVNKIKPLLEQDFRITNLLLFYFLIFYNHV